MKLEFLQFFSEKFGTEFDLDVKTGTVVIITVSINNRKKKVIKKAGGGGTLKLRRPQIFFLITPPRGGKPQTTISCVMWCWMNVSHWDNKVWALGSLPPSAASWPGGDFLPAASTTQGYYCGGGSERRCSTCLKFPLGPPRRYHWAGGSQPVVSSLLNPGRALSYRMSRVRVLAFTHQGSTWYGHV